MSKNTDSHFNNLRPNIRKNNIFGEREDHVTKGFLVHGGEACFYSPDNDDIIIGRTRSKIYVALIKHIDQPGPMPTLSDNESANLKSMAGGLNGTAIYGVDRTYCRAVKWFDIDGNKLVSL